MYDSTQFFDLTNSNFQVSFGSLEDELPLTIGRFVPYYVQLEMKKDGEYEKKKTEINTSRCPEEFTYSNNAQTFLNRTLCLSKDGLEM